MDPHFVDLLHVTGNDGTMPGAMEFVTSRLADRTELA